MRIPFGGRGYLWPCIFLLGAFPCRSAADDSAATCASPVDRERAYEHFIAGNELYSGGNLEAAVVEYRTGLEFDPEHADTLCNLGSVLQDLSDFRGALVEYEKAVAANRFHAVAHWNIGLLLHVDDVDKAIEHYQAALDADPMMADAWSNLGSAYHSEAHYEEAVWAYTEAITLFEAAAKEQEPGIGLQVQAEYLISLYYHIGLALSSLPNDSCEDHSCTEQAAEYLAKALALDPHNSLAQHHLSSLIEDPALPSASPDYVRRLFDSYADTFDVSLHGLGYKAPDLLLEFVSALRPRFQKCLDLGCGTGVARDRGFYSTLIEGGIAEETAKMAKQGDKAADLVVSADTLVYIGDLKEVFESVAGFLEPQHGLFAFTLEKLTAEKCQDTNCKGWSLTRAGRFAHEKGYVTALAMEQGMKVIVFEEITPRLEGGKPVEGYLVLMTMQES